MPPTHRLPLPFVVCAVAIGVALLWVALPSPEGSGACESTPMESVLGPYTMNATTAVQLAFPQCAFVVVHWEVVSGGPTDFSVGTGEAVITSDCTGPPPSNATCIPTFCGNVSMGPGPICFETGMGGTCSFTATQPQYDFGVFRTVPGGIGPVATNESATVTIVVS